MLFIVDVLDLAGLAAFVLLILAFLVWFAIGALVDRLRQR